MTAKGPEKSGPFLLARRILIRPASGADQVHLIFKDTQNPLQIRAALQDQSTRCHHRKGALAARQPRVFFDPVKRNFARLAEDRKHCLVAVKVDGVVAPFSARDLPAVERQNGVEFLAVKRRAGRRIGSGGGL